MGTSFRVSDTWTIECLFVFVSTIYSCSGSDKAMESTNVNLIDPPNRVVERTLQLLAELEWLQTEISCDELCCIHCLIRNGQNFTAKTCSIERKRSLTMR